MTDQFADSARIMRAEQMAKEKQQINAADFRKARLEKAKELISTKGHPLAVFDQENKAFSELINQAKIAIEQGEVSQKLVNQIRGIVIHYDKKGDLLYPPLKATYLIPGPADAMWTEDDEIRDELAELSKDANHNDAWMARFTAVLKRAEQMIIKEDNILFTNCAMNFKQEEWYGIYHDAKAYPDCLDITPEVWTVAEENKKVVDNTLSDEEVVMAGGHMTVNQLAALLNTIPMEITFVDDNNINRFFNEGPKEFKRPAMAIDREVFSCHPPKIEEQVRHIFDAFRAGEVDEVPIWMEKNGKTMLVRYMAVRDKEGKYLGTVELVQNMDFAKEYFLPKKPYYGED